MLNKITSIIVIFMLSISLGSSQSENELFEQGNEAYLNEIESARGENRAHKKPANSSTQLDLKLVTAKEYEEEAA